MSFACLLVELPTTELALDTVVSLFFHLLKRCLLLHRHATTASTRTLASFGTDRLSELHRLEFPLGDLALLLFGLRLRCLFCLHFLCVGVFLESLARCIGRLSLSGHIKSLSLFNEYLLADLTVLDDCLLVELAPTVLALGQLPNFSVLVWLAIATPATSVDVGGLLNGRVRIWGVLIVLLLRLLVILLGLGWRLASSGRGLRLVWDLFARNLLW